MIYKEKEFAKFLQELEDGSKPFWINIAEAIGVDQDTITKWKELPEAQAAMRRGIENTLREMENVGRKDWRMWEQRLKMFGINPIQKSEVEIKNPIGEILGKYGINATKTPETKSRPSTDSEQS